MTMGNTPVADAGRDLPGWPITFGVLWTPFPPLTAEQRDRIADPAAVAGSHRRSYPDAAGGGALP